jgi:GT2 family glycosyltransferase
MKHDPMTTADVTVAICTHRRYRGALQALNSLVAQQECNATVRPMLVDNVPDYDSIDRRILVDAFEQLPNGILLTESQLGVSHARNRALYSCESPVIAYLDDDCRASPLWLSGLLSAYFSAGYEIGAVGGPVRGEWTEPPPAWLSAPLLPYLSLLDWGGARITVVPPRYLLGGNVLYSVDATRRIGGFKCHLGRIGGTLLSNEEMDICDRLRYAGTVLLYEPSALVNHIIDTSRLTQQWFRRRIFWQAISDVLLDASSGCARPLSSRLLRIPEPNDASFWNELKALYNLTISYATEFHLEDGSKERDAG